MKKISLIFCLAAVLLAVGCGEDGEQQKLPESSYTMNLETVVLSEKLPFEARYIRTNAVNDQGDYYPVVKVISTSGELADYIASEQASYDFEHGFDGNESFSEAVKKYDDDYFLDNALVFIVASEPSGSIQLEVTDITQDKDLATVHIRELIPSVQTDDMAEWHIFLEIPWKDYGGGAFSPVFTQVEEAPAE